MKALILAAGIGSRLSKYTKECPKGMLHLGNKSVIEHQIEQFAAKGINDIAIVTGYMAEMITFQDVVYFHNTKYKSTNMVESMMCARDFLNDDIIISYSDIYFEESALDKLLTSNSEVSVLADKNWREYWLFRYGTTEFDLESFEIGYNGKLVSLGKEVQSSQGIEYRYVGLNKFSKVGICKTLDIYDRLKAEKATWESSGKTFENGYMTDLINSLISNNVDVEATICNGGWFELDTNEDYEKVVKLFV